MDKVVTSPLVYAGGKRWLYPKLSEYIPPDIKEVVSPFFGGGAIELNLAHHKNVRVYGYDLFDPLVNFWRNFLQQSQQVVNDAIFLLEKYKRPYFSEIHAGGYHELPNKYSKAVHYFLISRMSFMGTAFRSATLRNLYKKGLNRKYLKTFEYYSNFSRKVSVSYGDCLETLKIFPNTFAYCDPPYAELSTGLYGDSEEYHENFDHERLARILRHRPQTIISYNDIPMIRELYEGMMFVPVIRKSDGRTKKHEELLILSHDIAERHTPQLEQLRLFE